MLGGELAKEQPREERKRKRKDSWENGKRVREEALLVEENWVSG